MEQATNIALNNGWKPIGQTALLDKDFWIALGKGLGWDEKVCGECGGYLMSGTTGVLNYPKDCGENSDHWGRPIQTETWKWHMVGFMHHLAEGKDINSFFDSLLQGKTTTQ